MKRQLLHQVAAGLLGSLVSVQLASAQQQNTGTQNTGGGGGGTSTPLGGSNQATGMNLPTLDFSQGTTSGGGAAGTGTTGRTQGGAGSTARGGTTRRSTTGRAGGSTLGLSAGSLGGGLGGAMGGVGRGGAQSMQNNNRQNELRAQYITRLAFTPAPPAPGFATQVQSSVEKSLAAITPGVTRVTMEGSTAVLSGTVPSDSDRKLAERMALLEPGVREVRNELVVANPPAAQP